MTPLLRIRDVSKAYPDGNGKNVVFETASLDVEPGTQVGVYGKRRSGKSTLMRIAAGIERPDGGSVMFDGSDLAHVSGGTLARLLRRKLAYVALNDWRPNPGESVTQHLAVSLGGDGLTVHQAETRALRELDFVGVSAAQANSPATQLSMVDRTRVMLARALARKPWLIVIDDPILTPSSTERDRLYKLVCAAARERGAALLVASEDFVALTDFDVIVSISARELCSSDGTATIVPFPALQLDPLRDAGS